MTDGRAASVIFVKTRDITPSETQNMPRWHPLLTSNLPKRAYILLPFSPASTSSQISPSFKSLKKIPAYAAYLNSHATGRFTPVASITRDRLRRPQVQCRRTNATAQKNSSATDNAAFPQLTWPNGIILPPKFGQLQRLPADYRCAQGRH